MLKNILFIAMLMVAIFAGQASPTNAETNKSSMMTEWMPCTVQDPTRTPLNVRAKPNGKILTTVKNGTLVAIDDSTAGNKWSRISVKKGRREIIGWVLRDYLSCQ